MTSYIFTCSDGMAVVYILCMCWIFSNSVPDCVPQIAKSPTAYLLLSIISLKLFLCLWFVKLDFFLFADKTVKLWKISERDKRPEGYNLKDEDGRIRDPGTITTLRVSAVLSIKV